LLIIFRIMADDSSSAVMAGSDFVFSSSLSSSSLNTTVGFADVGCEKKPADMSQDFFAPTMQAY
jgi:hypothetical protein